MEGVFAEYLPRLVASWNPQCSAVNRSVVQQLGQQIVALEEDLCRYGMHKICIHMINEKYSEIPAFERH